VLLSFYHRRRTSACYSAYPSRQRSELAQRLRAPLEPAVLVELRRQDFETIVLHGHQRAGNPYVPGLQNLAKGPSPLLKTIRESPEGVAYAILAPAPKETPTPPRA